MTKRNHKTTTKNVKTTKLTTKALAEVKGGGWGWASIVFGVGSTRDP